MIKEKSVSQILAEQYKKKLPTTTKTDVDLLIEVPNLGLADGYGQSARSMIKIFTEIAQEEGIKMRVLNKKNVCPTIKMEDEFKEISELLVNGQNLGKVELYLRYALPDPQRYGAKKFVTMTMFETDTVPPRWVKFLNDMDGVIVPTEWGAEVFRKNIKPPVHVVPLPISKEYYQTLDEKILLPNTEKFRFITVGTYFYPDRKRLIPLIETFGKRFKDENCELYVKSTQTDTHFTKINIADVCGKYSNVILNGKNVNTEELISLFCSSHAGLFPSYGEGYGLPQVELGMLGRPIIVSDNTSLISMKNYIPLCFTVPAEKKVPSNYLPQKIENTGNWFECDIDDFLDIAEKLYSWWLEDKENYNNYIYTAKHSKTLRDYISHESIKKRFRKIILEYLGD